MEHTELFSSQAVTKLDDSVWRGWQQRDRRRDERAAASRVVAVNCCSAAALLAALALAAGAPRFGIALSGIVATGAAVVAYHAASMRRYGFTVVFLFLAVLFNPFVAVVSGLSGAWKLGAAVAGIGAFSASLIWLRGGRERRSGL
jgi:hypothetical protein